ncbi:unnamed protein product [Staurois parvus]|uniref:Immunoglobulin V-set domain-containing protein n=1 Tax=Staurois parvus TaxID=386267 RepID=A0ABN9BUH2_9NEOB|nr:unnamed protein product [Staurois parvus]
MTQTPDSISVSPGQTITITCTSSIGTDNHHHTENNIAWYQQELGKSPLLLIYNADNRQRGFPENKVCKQVLVGYHWMYVCFWIYCNV